jgi:GTP-binding protein LepA
VSTLSVNQNLIRNFCIVAHIDHGKSTLADRLIEATHTVSGREMREQVLDQMDLERERGITIKASAVRMEYDARDGNHYILNLIDTPGHVDFFYEVSRSLSACEGALLVVDAAQGVEAQTVANVYLAVAQGLEIIPIINKIDLAMADADRVREELREMFGFRPEECLLVSAKEGIGTEEVLEAIVRRVPPPADHPDRPTRGLIFDSVYDQYRGVIAYVRMRDGEIRTRMPIRVMSTGKRFEVTEVGVFRPKMTPVASLTAGEVGYVIASMRDVRDTRVGDTITSAEEPALEALPGFVPAKPMVFCGLYPVDNHDYTLLQDALNRLALNDASLTYEPESSEALGFGFRCGFLGMLHMDIIQERLAREFDLELVATAPSVVYRVTLRDGTVVEIDNPAKLPPAERIEQIAEPFVHATIMTPDTYVGQCMELCQSRRGEFKDMQYLVGSRVTIEYHLPLAEILMDFFDSLKSRTKGYASLDYDHIGYRPSKLVKVEILINGEPVDALSMIVFADTCQARARAMVERLRDALPRQQFEVRVQAAIGSRVIASERVRPLRKNVTAKCYGGDITRKRKLLERQKEGKRRMKQIGQVQVPQEAFLSILKAD